MEVEYVDNMVKWLYDDNNLLTIYDENAGKHEIQLEDINDVFIL